MAPKYMQRGPSCDLDASGDPVPPHYVPDRPDDAVSTSYQLDDLLAGNYTKGVSRWRRPR